MGRPSGEAKQIDPDIWGGNEGGKRTERSWVRLWGFFPPFLFMVVVLVTTLKVTPSG